jgi:tetratricopeptide (TPR) repeat protein
MKIKALLPLCLIAVLGFAVYANSIGGDFVWDDEVLIRKNLAIRSFSNIKGLFREGIGKSGAVKFPSYRPLQMVTYAIDHSLWGLDPRGYHVINILLHILAAICVYWLLCIISGDGLVSFFAGAVFAVHPIHTEAVAYISGRADPLAAVFLLLCFISYVKFDSSRNILAYFAVIAAYTLALLSRESSLILPALLLIYHYAFRKRIRMGQLLPILAMTVAYIILRFTLLSEILSDKESFTTLAQRLPGVFAAVGMYVKLLVLPFDLHMEYGQRVFSPVDPKVFFGIAVFATTLFLALKAKQRDRFVYFSILWFFAALIPQLNLYPIENYMAEHWVYLPSIGFFAILGKGFSHIYGGKRLRLPAAIAAALIIAFYGAVTVRQNRYWIDDVSLYNRTLEYNPDNPKIYKIYNNMGIKYFKQERYEMAIESYKTAIKISPVHANAYSNLGNVYATIGRNEEAVEVLKKSLSLKPDNAEAHNNLGIAYKNIRMFDEAMDSFSKAAELEPESDRAYINLGGTYAITGRHEEALPFYKKALEINPSSETAYYNLGHSYSALGRYGEAVEAFEKLTEINPRRADAFYNLAVAYYYEGDYELAIRNCDKAVSLGQKVDTRFLEYLKPYRR